MKQEKKWDKTHDPEDYLTNYLRTQAQTSTSAPTWKDALYAGGIVAILALASIGGLYLFY